MKKKYPKPLILFLFLLGTASSCSQDGGQRKFEREALGFAENITETNSSGEVVNDNSDPDDWRVGPYFQGLVEVFPAYPNPVLTSDRVYLDIQVLGFDAVNGLIVLVYYGQNSFKFLYEDPRSPLPPGAVSVSLPALDITRFPENPEGLYRIIIEDQDENIISYGDVQIE